ncbi:hypothetical protein [Bartonella harrusi]|uniref:Uncharacterized protein n=1 Tax=Bartonella harrusi TaxID=2961895 RepID=A0ABY5EWB4_9HYPH|nr:hypothetical protein [Bartonella harrusi]UTO28178.1 hypothetical protein NMK50_08390 [Bartonella harrusi]
MLKKNRRKLKEANPQWEKRPCLQNNLYKKDNKDKCETVIMFFSFVLLVVALIVSDTSFFSMIILQLYFGVFKQVRMSCCVKGELQKALQEHEIMFVKA